MDDSWEIDRVPIRQSGFVFNLLCSTRRCLVQTMTQTFHNPIDLYLAAGRREYNFQQDLAFQIQFEGFC